VPAVEAHRLRWQMLDDATRRLLDPADALAAATPTMALSWTPDPLAAPVVSLGAYTGSVATGAVNQGRVIPARGATSAVAEAPSSGTCGTGTTFPALTADGQSWRTLQMRLRLLDGSQQDSFVQFN